MEFLMTFAFVVMFIGVFTRFAINITNGYIVHYVTYQASRHFLVFDDNSEEIDSVDQRAGTSAKEFFSEFLPDFPQQQIEAIVPRNGATSRNVFTGIVTKFKQPFALPSMGGDAEMDMTSESFLGRIPIIHYCLQRTCEAVKLSGGPDKCGGNTTLADNGC